MRLDLATLVLSTATFVVTLAPAAFAGDDHRCSYRSVAGPFGYTTSGTRAGTPVAGAGIATFEEDGGAYNQADAAGFIKLNALRMRIAANKGRKLF